MKCTFEICHSSFPLSDCFFVLFLILAYFSASEEVSGLQSESSGVPSSTPAETIEEKLEEAVRLEQEAIQAVSSTKQQLHQGKIFKSDPVL